MGSAKERDPRQEERKVTVSKKPLLIGLAVVVIALVEVIPVMSYSAGVSDAYQTSNCNALPPPGVCSQLSSQLSIPWVLLAILGIAVLLGMFVSVRAVQGRYA
jgi:hypothetical protein